METYQFFKYNKCKIVVQTEEKFYWTNNHWDDKTFTEIGDINIFPNYQNREAFTTLAPDIETAYYNYVGSLIQERSKKRSDAKEYDAKMNKIAEDLDSYSPLEIYHCALYFNKILKSYYGADLLLKSEVFKAKMFEHFKTFTVTPFDNGLLLIKCDNKIKFGNHRGYQDIEEYLK